MIVDEQVKIGTEITDFTNAESNEDMELALKILIQQTDASIDAVQKLGAWKGDGALQNSALQLFKFYKAVAEKEYREMLNILKKEVVSDTDATHLDAIIADIQLREQKFDDDFAYQQKDFAKRNGFTLE
jgi:hypothetical protein